MDHWPRTGCGFHKLPPSAYTVTLPPERFYRVIAAQTRALADRTQHETTRQELLDRADRFDRIAAERERRA